MSVCVTWHKKVHYQEQIQLVVGRGEREGEGGWPELGPGLQDHCSKPLNQAAFFNAVQSSL